jgi:hypothetical protein
LDKNVVESSDLTLETTTSFSIIESVSKKLELDGKKLLLSSST